MKQRLNGPPLTRAAMADASVIDETSRSLRLSFSSEIAYLRASFFDEPWIEILGHDDGECDLSRINSGSAPLLWGHDAGDRENNVGVIERAWIENGKGYADVRFSARQDVADLFNDVRDGIVTNVSVGYQIRERTLVKQNNEGPDEYRVTSWLPMEISLVSVPADDSVGVGRSDARKFTCTNIKDTEMTEQVQNQPAAPAPELRQVETASAPDLAVVAREMAENAVRSERARIAEISALARQHNLGDEFVREQTVSGVSVADAHKAALAVIATRGPEILPNITAGADQVDKTRAAAEVWLLHRGGEKVEQSALNGNDFRGMTLLDMARHAIGSPRGLNSNEIAQRATSHSTSDFPIILQNVMHKSLQTAYMNTPDVWREFCAVGSLSDFRPHYRYRMGSFGNLATVAENGAFTYGTISDAQRESITGATKGKLLNVSRQMIINDDLGGFLNIVRAMGRGAARTVEVDVFALLASNPTMGDGGALFNATAVTTAGGHANLNASGAAPTVAGFEAARAAMAVQLDVGSNDYISVKPSIWLGPVALRGQAAVTNDSQYDLDVSSKTSFYPNKSRGLFDKVIDTPRLTGNIWYAFANPSDEPVIEVGFLNGQQSPYTEMQQGFEVDGVTWKVRLDYGVAAVGYRGAHKVTY